jgi:hypothetical protein
MEILLLSAGKRSIATGALHRATASPKGLEHFQDLQWTMTLTGFMTWDLPKDVALVIRKLMMNQ